MRRHVASFMHRLIFAVLAAVTPTEVDPWRLAPTEPPARFLPIGDPVTAIWSRAS